MKTNDAWRQWMFGVNESELVTYDEHGVLFGLIAVV